MKLATFNVNSVRARLPILTEWLVSASPDVVALQETKVEDDKFPIADFEALGYHVSMHGQKSYCGVAFLSKTPAVDVEWGFPDPDWPKDARIIRGVFDGVLLINTYVPNGTSVGSEKWDYKLRWLDRFKQMCGEVAGPNDRVIWLGDINIAPTSDDVYESHRHLGGVGHHPDEFSRLAEIVDWGWTDCFRRFVQGPKHYTFWDLRLPNGFKRDLGWRIDHIYASPAVVDNCVECFVDKEPRGLTRPSDHTPLVATFDWASASREV